MLKHPLVQKEWKTARWIMLLISFIFAFGIIVLNNIMYDIKISHLIDDYRGLIFMERLYNISTVMVPALLLSIVLLTSMLFIHDRSVNVGKFVNSLPFTRKEQFTIKYIVGIATFTIPYILFGIAVYMINNSHKVWIYRKYKYLPYGEILRDQDGGTNLFMWLVLMWFVILTAYSFLIMIQTLIGQNFVAGILGGIIFLVPWFLAFAIPANLNLLLSYSIEVSDKALELAKLVLFGNPEFQFIETIPIPSVRGIAYYSNYLYYTINYQVFSLYIAVLIGIIIITTLLGYRFIQDNDVEKNGDIAMYPWVRKILIVGVSVCSGLLSPIIIVVFTRIENAVVSLIAMIIGGTLGYLISSKSIELTTKHG